MTFWLYHVGISVLIGIIFGALIDLDHGLTRPNMKCALSLDYKDCVHAGMRGVFHEKFFWYLFSVSYFSYSVHLIMDGVLA